MNKVQSVDTKGKQHKDVREQYDGIASKRTRRQIRPFKHYDYADMVLYTIFATEKMSTYKSTTFKKNISCPEAEQ